MPRIWEKDAFFSPEEYDIINKCELVPFVQFKGHIFIVSPIEAMFRFNERYNYRNRRDAIDEKLFFEFLCNNYKRLQTH